MEPEWAKVSEEPVSDQVAASMLRKFLRDSSRKDASSEQMLSQKSASGGGRGNVVAGRGETKKESEKLLKALKGKIYNEGREK